MITDGRVKGLPLVQYADTKANIAALTLTAADAGAEAYATDTGEIGVYSGSAWVWGKTVTNGNGHDHDGGDGAQIDHTKLSNIGTNTHAQIDTHVGSTSNPHSVTAAQVGADITTVTVHAASSKNTPVDDDETVLLDSADTYKLKKLTWKYIKETLKTYFDTLYNKYVHPNHTGEVTSVGDGATTIANKQTLSATAPITISNTPTVIAGAAPVIAVNAASETATGVVERATDAEARAGSDTERYVTPNQLIKYARGPRIVTAQIFKDSIADNTATAVFSVSTTNESGSNDGGGYTCLIRAIIGHALTSTAGASAISYLTARFTRVMANGGTGVLSSVTSSGDSVVAIDAATRSIGSVIVSIAENSEYRIDVSFTIDLSGSSVATAQVYADVEVLWGGFVTAPTIAAI